MKKPMIVLLGILLLVSVVGIAGAQETLESNAGTQETIESKMAIGKSLIMRPIPGPDVGTFGQNHYYAVTFDEEGEAAIAARFEFQNTKKDPLETLTLEIPGTPVRMINAFQEVQDKKQRCGSWTVPVPFAYDTAAEDVPKEYYDKCMNWYDYYETKYYGVDVKENKLSKSSEYTFTFKKPVTEQNTGALVIYYKAQGYSTKSLGTFNFDFETAKLNQDINSVRVAVTVLEGLSMKGVEGNVEYRSSGMEMKVLAASYMAEDGIVSSDLQNFAQQIKWANGLVKTAQGLDPLESFHVTGTYARSKLALYSKPLFISGLVIVLVLIGIIFGVKRIFAAPSPAKTKSTKAAAVITGLVCALLMFGIWVVSFLLTKFMVQTVDYQMQSIVILIVGVLAVVLSIALFVIPPLLVGWKFGMIEGVIAFGTMLGMLLLLAIIAVIVLAIAGTSYQPQVMNW